MRTEDMMSPVLEQLHMSVGIVHPHTEMICVCTPIAGYIHLHLHECHCISIHVFCICMHHFYAPFQNGAVCTSGPECMCLLCLCVHVCIHVCAS